MTQHPRNLNAILPTSRDVRDLAWVVFLVLAATVVPARAPAADKPSKPYRVSVSRLGAADDLDVEIHVRRAFGNDESLKRLSVHVAAGVAQLFGSVPSADLKKKAIVIAAGVPGVLEVRAEEVYLGKAPPVVKPLLLPLDADRPTQTRSASPNSLSGVVENLTSRDPPPPRPNSPAEAPTAPRRVTLMAPEAVTAPSRTSEPAVLTANPRTPLPASSVAASVERLRQSDHRFRSIHSQVDGSTVRVFSGDIPGSQVMAFVQAIRRLPGVQHVILKDTSSRPH
ncbi:MAG TPA: BON domain-containing protein [Gemmataceae bacterium]|jgi:hypothetical protein